MILAHAGFLKIISQYRRNIILIIYNNGNINPMNDIGQNILGLIYGERYDVISRNKLIEFSRYKILFTSDKSFIYFLLALKSIAFSSLFKLSYPDLAIFSKILSISLFFCAFSELNSISDLGLLYTL